MLAGLTILCGCGGGTGTGSETAAGSNPPAAVDPTPIVLGGFRGNIVLGSPTATAIKANVFATDQSGSVWLTYGRATGSYAAQSSHLALAAARPVELAMDGLLPNTRYYYRLYFQSADGTGSGFSPEYSFHTARATGSSFTFAIQGDSHPEREKTQFDATLYARTLQAVAADRPDFYIMSGDDFSVDTLNPATIDASQVSARYTLQRPYLGLVGHSSPIYMVNGNHEQAAAYLLDGTPNNVAVWAQSARNAHYSQPAPDGFYTGNDVPVPFVGLLRNYYAWTWGDALFVTIDPYWASPVAVDNTFNGSTKRLSMWDVTHGDAQYNWLKKTLEESKARFKFVFAHHVMGTGRGGIELVRQWEWGGEDSKGVSYFTLMRPVWPSPIHQLFVKNGVNIFFQGHDHIWVHQQIDGVTYQTLSEPADPNYSLFNADAYLSGDKFPNSGYTRVSVGPSGVKVEYVRTYLPQDEGPGKTSGSVAFSYSLP
ncbi:MAG: metallophosphoesterase [Rhodoferax sp.]